MRFFCENSVEDRAKRFYRNVPSARRATIAQSVEQPPCKRRVGSSILPGGFVLRRLVFGRALLSMVIIYPIRGRSDLNESRINSRLGLAGHDACLNGSVLP